jgi:hypothetical protein
MNKKKNPIIGLIAFILVINIIFPFISGGDELFTTLPSFFTIVIVFSVLSRMFTRVTKNNSSGEQTTNRDYTSFFEESTSNKPQHECEYCGHMNDTDREYCENCGARQLDVDQ